MLLDISFFLKLHQFLEILVKDSSPQNQIMLPIDIRIWHSTSDPANFILFVQWLSHNRTSAFNMYLKKWHQSLP